MNTVFNLVEIDPYILCSFQCAATSLLSGSEEVYREDYASTNHGEIDFNCKKGRND